jgi:hypothetical protein
MLSYADVLPPMLSRRRPDQYGATAPQTVGVATGALLLQVVLALRGGGT